MKCPVCGRMPKTNGDMYWLLAKRYPDRGWPADVSESVASEQRIWVGQGGFFAPTYFSLKEMLCILNEIQFAKGDGSASDVKPTEVPFYQMADFLMKLGYLARHGDPEDVRVLVFFD